MAKYAQGLVDANYAGNPAGMSGKVRELVVKLLSTGQCTIDEAAQHLGVNRRTIHRQLAEAGETFSAIVDSVRRELAARYVKDKHRTLADVSLLLGFSAPSGFSRWYRRQFKGTATERRSRSPRRAP